MVHAIRHSLTALGVFAAHPAAVSASSPIDHRRKARAMRTCPPVNSLIVSIPFRSRHNRGALSRGVRLTNHLRKPEDYENDEAEDND